MSRILIIEDDPDIALSLKYYLETEGGFAVATAGDGDAGLDEAVRRPPDLVILDLSLPGMDGLEVCKRMRSRPETTRVPIVMVTARVEERDKVFGLDAGADDYVTKPFSMREVLARVRAVLRRSGEDLEGADTLSAGPVRMEESSRRVWVDGGEVTLTRKEFDLLAALIRQRGRVLSRQRLLERVWGYQYPGESRTVDVHVRQLRRKLGTTAAELIETVVGVGYRLRGEG